MTLIITEVSKHGIAMVADSAITTWNYNQEKYKYFIESVDENGAIKLLKIDYLNAGISWWGLADIGKVSTEKWLINFIQKNKQCKSIVDFVKKLETELRQQLGKIDMELGFHLAGYEVVKGKGLLPSFYHVTNSAVNNCFDHTTKEFEAQPDYPAEKYNPAKFHLTRNGDYFIYANISEMLEKFFNRMAATQDVIIPGKQSLDGREEYLRFYIGLIKKIFSISNLDQTIGGKITSLKINSSGIQDYKTE